jgi:tyrosine-protein phosphatase SIW14
MRRSRAALLIMLNVAVPTLLSCAGPEVTSDPGAATPAVPKPRWAVPLEGPGLHNVHQVSRHLYRGAQPSAEGMRHLSRIGIKTIVNLRALHSDRDEIGGLPLAYEHIRMNAWHPEDEDVLRFLKIVTDAKKTPVFVHCQYGADRTGTMCAIYRILVSGWTKEDAIKEMTEGGFGYHTIWKKLIRYIRELDVDRIRRKAGL